MPGSAGGTERSTSTPSGCPRVTATATRSPECDIDSSHSATAPTGRGLPCGPPQPGQRVRSATSRAGIPASEPSAARASTRPVTNRARSCSTRNSALRARSPSSSSPKCCSGLVSRLDSHTSQVTVGARDAGGTVGFRVKEVMGVPSARSRSRCVAEGQYLAGAPCVDGAATVAILSFRRHRRQSEKPPNTRRKTPWTVPYQSCSEREVRTITRRSPPFLLSIPQRAPRS